MKLISVSQEKIDSKIAVSTTTFGVPVVYIPLPSDFRLRTSDFGHRRVFQKKEKRWVCLSWKLRVCENFLKPLSSRFGLLFILETPLKKFKLGINCHINSRNVWILHRRENHILNLSESTDKLSILQHLQLIETHQQLHPSIIYCAAMRAASSEVDWVWGSRWFPTRRNRS